MSLRRWHSLTYHIHFSLNIHIFNLNKTMPFSTFPMQMRWALINWSELRVDFEFRNGRRSHNFSLYMNINIYLNIWVMVGWWQWSGRDVDPIKCKNQTLEKWSGQLIFVLYSLTDANSAGNAEFIFHFNEALVKYPQGWMHLRRLGCYKNQRNFKLLIPHSNHSYYGANVQFANGAEWLRPQAWTHIHTHTGIRFLFSFHHSALCSHFVAEKITANGPIVQCRNGLTSHSVLIIKRNVKHWLWPEKQKWKTNKTYKRIRSEQYPWDRLICNRCAANVEQDKIACNNGNNYYQDGTERITLNSSIQNAIDWLNERYKK